MGLVARRLLVAVTVVAALAGASAVVPAVPASAEPRVDARSAVPDGASVAGGAPVAVTVYRVSRGHPVLVSWGDGRVSRVSRDCGAAAARRNADSCSGTVQASYAKPGSYKITARQDGRVVGAGRVTVVGSASGADPDTAPAPAWHKEMLAAVNAVRASAGAKPVRFCAPLTRAAQGHSTDMAERGFFSHVSPEGQGPGDRLAAEGYHGGYGENIAYGQPDVAAVVRSWQDSPGHYANMVDAGFDRVGFGVATRDGVPYWTQVFGGGGTC